MSLPAAGPAAPKHVATRGRSTFAAKAAASGDHLARGASTKNLGRNSLILSIGTFVSRATGQVRTILLVAAIGVLGTVANAFDIANTLPNMLFALLAAGVIQAVLMPHIMHAIRAENTQERLDKLVTLAATTLFVVTLILVLATPLLIRLFTLSGKWPPEAIALAIAFGYWCIPQVFFYGMFSVQSELLNARGQFGATGWAPVANNIICIAGFSVFIFLYGGAGRLGEGVAGWAPHQTVLLAGTATLGIVVQASILFFALRRGGFYWHLRFGLHGIGLRSAGKVVGWTIGAVVLEQLGVVYLMNITSAAGQAGAAAGHAVAGNAVFNNALLVYLLPHSLVVVSIITALFPRMSMSAAAGDLDGVRSAMSTGMRTAGVFSVISTVVLIVLAEPLMKSLLPTLSAESIEAIAPVLRALATGLVALGATVMVKRMYFAFEDGRGIFIIQIFATVAMVLVLFFASRAFPSNQWAIWAAVAYSLSTWISVLLRISGMNKKLNGLDGARILRLYGRAVVAGLAAAVVGGVLGYVLGAYHYQSWGRAVLTCAVTGPAMLAVYGLGLKLMRVQEFTRAIAPITRRLRRAES